MADNVQADIGPVCLIVLREQDDVGKLTPLLAGHLGSNGCKEWIQGNWVDLINRLSSI